MNQYTITIRRNGEKIFEKQITADEAIDAMRPTADFREIPSPVESRPETVAIPKKAKKIKAAPQVARNDEGGVSAVDRAIIAGEKPAAIAKRFKKTVGAIYVRKSVLKKEGKLAPKKEKAAPAKEPETAEEAIDEMRGQGFKPITPETLNKVKDMLAAGEPLEDVASATGLDFDRVEKMAAQLGY